MDLTEYFKTMRRRWVSIVVIAALFGAFALAFALLQTKQYSSSARLFVSTSGASDVGSLASGGQFTIQRVQSYADLVSSNELASLVISDLDLSLSPREMAAKVTGEAAVDTVNLTLIATDSDPHRAQQIAQVYAENLAELIRQLETPSGQTVAPVKATIIDQANFSDDPVSPQPVRDTGLGLVLGLVVGLGVAALRQTFDTRIHSAQDVQQILDRPILGSIGLDSNAKETPLITAIPSHSPRAEAFRVLRTNLQFVDVDTHNKVFVISSAVPEEGKTSTTINLALSLAQAGVRTLLIEGDLRRPRAAVRIGFDNAVGVTNVLVGQVKFEDAVQRDDQTGLDFLASGAVPPNPAELLQSRAMQDLLAELRAVYDVVLIDAPPLLPVTDAALLATHADGAILVVRHGKITKEQVRLSGDRLAQVDARLIGIVMNMVPSKGRGGYGYGYGYGYAPDEESASEKA